jgi:hypothetical protein
VTVEECDECGFSADQWSDAGALAALEELPARFAGAVEGLTPSELLRRPVDGQWSIAEYVDHVREVLFGMRFLVEMAVTAPGTDLGQSPSTPLSPDPRPVEIDTALAGVERETKSLRQSLSGLSPNEWRSMVIFDSTIVDPCWIVRHALHDSTHHLLDIERLRLVL